MADEPKKPEIFARPPPHTTLPFIEAERSEAETVDLFIFSNLKTKENLRKKDKKMGFRKCWRWKK